MIERRLEGKRKRKRGTTDTQREIVSDKQIEKQAYDVKLDQWKKQATQCI